MTTPLESLDLLVFGTGAAGQTAAYAAAEAGWSVAMIDTAPPGGTCANRGCDAKKPLVNLAKAIDLARRTHGHGITNAPQADWAQAMAFKRTFTDPIPGNTRKDLEKAGITLVEASEGEHPGFVDPDTVAVGERRLTAKKFVIAAGLRPRTLDFDGAQHAIDSNDFLELDALPQRIVFIGGGYIGMEFAHVCARLGREVTVVEKNGCPMKHFDHDMAQRLRDASTDAGIDLQCDTCIDGIEKNGEGFVATCSETGARFEADLVVNAAGRVPSIDGMNLDKPGVETTGRGVKVDKFLRSVSDDRFYAAGDVADSGNPQLTPTAGFEAKTLTHNLLHPQSPRELEEKPVASIVFTVPPLASVGLTETLANKRGLDFEVVQGDASGFKDNRQLGVKHAAYKVLIEKGTDKVLGATYLGHDADQHINLVALGMTHSLTATQIRQVLYAYPTPGSTLPSTLK